MKKLISVIALLSITGLAAAQVEFTQTEDIPSQFAGGESFQVNTSFQNSEGEPLPVIFQLKVLDDESNKVSQRAFDINITSTNLGTQPSPCSFGEIFNRNVCAFSAAPTGEYFANFEISSAINLAPGNYNISINLLSLEGDTYLGELFQYWGNPTNISRGETTSLTDGSFEANIRPSKPGPNETEDAWAYVKEIPRTLQQNPDNLNFIAGGQVLVNQDLAQKSGVTNITKDQIFGSSDQSSSERGGIDTALVMDSSGSMGFEAGKLENAKNGGKAYINETNTAAGDENAVVDFDSDYLIRQQLTSNKTKAKNAIDELDASGGTDHVDALKGGIKALETSNSSKKVMIVLGDGCGGTAETQAERARNKSIEIHTIMYGSGPCPKDFQSMLPEGQICEEDPNASENRDGDQCWYSNTENISDVFGQVQDQINTGYIRNATEAQLFGGEIGQVDANGSVSFDFNPSNFRRSTVSIYRWNNSLEGENPQGWERLPTTISNGEAQAQVEEFSTFALFGRPAPASTGETPPVDTGGGITTNVTFGETPVNGSEVAQNQTEAAENASQTAQNQTGNIPGQNQNQNQQQPPGQQNPPQGQQQGPQNEQQDDQPQGPTGLFAAGVPDFISQLMSWVASLWPF